MHCTLTHATAALASQTVMVLAEPPGIRRTRSNSAIDNLPELLRDSTGYQQLAQAALMPPLMAHMLPPRTAPAQPEAVMPAQPAAPMVSRKPSMLNMSFFEELGQMTERSDDDTRKLLGKFAAEPEGSLPAMPPALKRLVSGEASGPPKMTRSNSAYLREMAQAQAQAQAQASSSSSSYQPLPPGAMDAPPAMAPPMVSGPPMVSKRKSSELLEEGLNLFTGGHLPNFSFSGVRARALLRPRPAPAPCARALHPRPATAPCTPSRPNSAPALADLLWGRPRRPLPHSADRAPDESRARLHGRRGGGAQASCRHRARRNPGEPPPLGPLADAA